MLETLEGPNPGEEIVVSVGRIGIGGYPSKIEDKTKLYMLGYQTSGGRIHGITVDTNDLYERDDGFLTDLKKWMRRILSECDNV